MFAGTDERDFATYPSFEALDVIWVERFGEPIVKSDEPNPVSRVRIAHEPQPPSASRLAFSTACSIGPTM